MKRKLIALVLACCLCLGVLPLGAYARDLASPMAAPVVRIDALPRLSGAELQGDHSVTMHVTGEHGTAELYATAAGTGESVYFLADPEPGYKVDLSGSYYYGTVAPRLYYLGLNMYELVMPDGDAVLEVEFVQITSDAHRVVVDAQEGGVITVSQSTAKLGESFLLEILVSPGYTLDSVTTSYGENGHADAFDLGNIGGARVYEIFMPDDELTICVTFTRNGPYSVDYAIDSEPAGGTLVLSHTEAYEAETVTVTAVPDTGYRLSSISCLWSQLTQTGENQYTFQMPRYAESVHASFEAVSYGLSLSVEDGIGGTAVFNAESALYDETVILSCQPYEGYRVARISGVEVTDLGSNFYTFRMPDRDVHVEILFLRENNPFLDVRETHFFHDPVLWAVEQGITSGTTDTTFSPYGVCNRAQVVTFLWRAAGSPAPESREMPFEDVADGTWYTDAVLWAVEQGITSGTTDTTFSPNGVCNRAQVVTFLWRAAGSPAHGLQENPFTDVAEGIWYAAPVLWALENGVTSGASDTTFNPTGECLRAQVVTFLYRAAMLDGE